jgi:acyl-CoA thioesterase
MSSQAILERLNANWEPCSAILGAHALAWDGERQELTLSFTVDERFCHSVDVLQGGFSTSMLDATMAYVGLCADDTIEHIPSLEIKVSFIAPGHPGTLICVARPVRIGGSIGFLEAELHQGDTLVATATATYKIIRRRPSA